MLLGEPLGEQQRVERDAEEGQEDAQRGEARAGDGALVDLLIPQGHMHRRPADVATAPGEPSTTDGNRTTHFFGQSSKFSQI